MFRGSIVALITPFHNGAVDESAYRALIEWQINEGGSACAVRHHRRSPTLDHAEHKRVVEICIEAAAGGTGDCRHGFQFDCRSH